METQELDELLRNIFHHVPLQFSWVYTADIQNKFENQRYLSDDINESILDFLDNIFSANCIKLVVQLPNSPVAQLFMYLHCLKLFKLPNSQSLFNLPIYCI